MAERSTEPPLVIDLDGTLLRSDLLHESTLACCTWRHCRPCACRSGCWRARPCSSARSPSVCRSTSPHAALRRTRAGLDRRRARPRPARGAVHRLRRPATPRRWPAPGLFDEVIASDGHTNYSAHRKADPPWCSATARAASTTPATRATTCRSGTRRGARSWCRRPASMRARGAPRCKVEREFGAALPPVPEVAQGPAPAPVAEEPARLPAAAGRAPSGRPRPAGAGVARLHCVRPVRVLGLCAQRPDGPRERPPPPAQAPAAVCRRPVAARRRPGVGGGCCCWRAFVACRGHGARPSWPGWRCTSRSRWPTPSGSSARCCVDALSLAALYTLRIIAGGAAVALPPSFWLLAFSLFLFLSLAFVKRYSELQVMQEEGRSDGGRARLRDAGPAAGPDAWASSSGFAAVLVMALYINSETCCACTARPS